MHNDLEQFSEESLKELIEHINQMPDANGKDQFAALARIALSVKQAKPVGYFSRVNGDGIWFEQWTDKLGVPLYTNPQPAHTEQVIPEGWKLVPIEPTPAMCEAGYTARDKWNSMQCDNQKELHFSFSQPRYKAMLAAAPKPESEQ